MQSYYSRQATLPHFSGHARQRGSGIGSLAELSSKQVRKPQFKIGDKVRIAKQDLPFKKGYKQNFTDEVFRITKVATFNPPTYSLSDGDGEDISGKFYEPELIKIRLQ